MYLSENLLDWKQLMFLNDMTANDTFNWLEKKKDREKTGDAVKEKEEDYWTKEENDI